MRKNRISCVAIGAFCLPLCVFGEGRWGETCISEFPNPPQMVETGLGLELDQLVHSAYPIQWRVRDVVRADWTIQYGGSSQTDKKGKVITVMAGQSVPYTTSHFAHETGHATSSFSEDWSSREAYIRSRCTDDGYALGVNIVARRTIKQCAGADTGVVSADVPYFTEWYETMAANPPILYGDFGYAFCERNIESITGKNYLAYYGDWYDAHFSSAPPSGLAFDNEPFFERIEALAHDAADGAEALQEHWPIQAPAREMRSNTVSYVGGGAPLVPGIDVRASEIRVRRTDPSHVVVANMQLSAPCISLDTVRARYPSAIVTGSPHNGSPDAYGTWSIFGPDGEIAFGFSYVNPKCVGRVTLVPGASPPA